MGGSRAAGPRRSAARFVANSAVALAVAASAAPALAAGGALGGVIDRTIQDGDATFKVSVFGANPTADFTGVASNLATDHVFKTGWWYRIGLDDREHPFPDPSSENWTLSGGKRADLAWDDLGGTGIQVTESIDVRSAASVTTTPSGYVTRYVVVTNTNSSGDYITVHLFYYLDLDLEGPVSGGDSASFGEYSTLIRLVDVEDAGGSIGAFVGRLYFQNPDALAYRVATYQTELLTKLNDTLVDDFANTGLPFAAADFTGIFQYHFNLPPGGSYVITASFFVNVSNHCQNLGGIFCDGFEIGAPDVWTDKQP
jgi:hypothetical protein